MAGAGSWVPRKEYAVDIFDATSASITENGRTTMYVIGGVPSCCAAGRITASVKAYDATSNTWVPKARFPVAVRSTNGAVELGGKIYVSGGFTRRRRVPPRSGWTLETLQSLYVYTPNSDTWSRKRDMPVTSANGATVAYQGMLYVAADRIVWRYNPSTDRWVQFAERQRDWWDVSAGVIGGKFYLVESISGNLDILDLATGAWSTGPARPHRACDMASTAMQAKLYLFGFCDDFPTDPENRARGLVFDPEANSWSELAPAPISSDANQGGLDAALARVVVNGLTRLSLVQGLRPNNHYQFTP
jgi:hypothetical protein